MKIEDNGEVTITAEGKSYKVSKIAAMSISLMLPKYADMIIRNVMPTYKLLGIEAARIQLAEMRQQALDVAPKVTQLSYGEAMINIAYDCVLAVMERHYAEKNAEQHEELPDRQEMN